MTLVKAEHPLAFEKDAVEARCARFVLAPGCAA